MALAWLRPLKVAPAGDDDKTAPSAAGSCLARALLHVTSTPREKVFWTLCSWLTDAFTICVSVADIATDVLVLLDFRRHGYKAFFDASLAIFVLAQCCYAFLFVASYAGSRRPLARCGVFLTVLPVAQLVPLFTWLEALRWPPLDRGMRRLGLEPSGGDENGPTAAGPQAGDSLWGFVQSKYQSHAGFLVEAFVEAVPQAVLQTLFVVLEHRGTALNAASVGISIFTVASKGYLLSYALDYLTFLFNFGCVSADCLGLFTIATGVAATEAQGPLRAAVLCCAGGGVVLSVVGGFALLWFTITDDHLKLRKPRDWPRGVRGTASVFFDLYVVRLAAWLLAIVPCLVLFAGARLSLVPICVLKSIDPDMVRHARFFRGLVSFLRGRGGGSDDLRLRLWTVNTFVARARRREHDLNFSLRGRGSSTSRATVFKSWLNGLFAPKVRAWYLPGAADAAPRGGAAAGDEDAALQQALLDSLSSGKDQGSAFASMATAAFRRSRALMWLRQTWRHTQLTLAARSEVFHTGLRIGPVYLHSLPDLALRCVAWVSLLVVALCAAPLLLSHGALIGLSVLYPAASLSALCGGGETCRASAAVSLPCGLTAAYCGALACLAAAAPFVVRRQLLWMDLVDLHGFPDEFYSGWVLAELRKRHLRDSMLRKRLGHYLAEYLLKFVEQ